MVVYLRYLLLAAFFLAEPTRAAVNVTVDAGQVIRLMDDRLFGVNAAIWDSSFNSTATINLLKGIDNKALRFPGGSISDEYHWASNKSGTNQWTWATSFDAFTRVATNTSAQVYITVNYGTGTPEEAASWVRYANVTKKLAIAQWEIGNENYGSWETDTHAVPHDPYTYGVLAADYISQMKGVDPTIKIGVVVVPGEDDYKNNTSHPATNPRTHQVHNGWSPVLFTTMRQLNIAPDFVIYHKYAQNPGQENDASLLQSSKTWSSDVKKIRGLLTDYFGAFSTKIEIHCTENNSVSSAPGKQTTSLVNALFLADSLGQASQTELSALVWWDMRNSQESGNNNSAALYGWRSYGDYGLASGANTIYPVYYSLKLLSHFARGGDKLVTAKTDASLVSAYAALRSAGTLNLLLINKSPSIAQLVNVTLAGYSPETQAGIYSYGILQDDAARTGSGVQDILSTNISNLSTNFSLTLGPYSLTVLEFGPDTTAEVLQLQHPIYTSEGFGFTASGTASFFIEASSDLRGWETIETNLLGTSAWFDPNTSTHTHRYYRLRSR